MGCGASTQQTSNPASVLDAVNEAEMRLARMMQNSHTSSAGSIGGSPPNGNINGGSSPAVKAMMMPASSTAVQSISINRAAGPTSSSSAAAADPFMLGMFADMTGIPVNTVGNIQQQVMSTDIFKQVQSAVIAPEGETKVLCLPPPIL